MEELGVPYEVMPLDMMTKREHKSEEFLKLNPNGKVPCLVDGDFVLWESLAINHYLCEKFKPALLGTTLEEKALVQQWSIWALGDLQEPLVEILIQMVFMPAEKRDMAVVEKARARVPGLLTILDKGLAGHSQVVRDTFTVADLNLVSVVGLALNLGFDLAAYPNIGKWFATIKERPSVKKYAALREQGAPKH
jgi:glutathione S-transferase